MYKGLRGAFLFAFIPYLQGMQSDKKPVCPVCLKEVDQAQKRLDVPRIVPGASVFRNGEHICPDFFHSHCLHEWQNTHVPCPTCHIAPHTVSTEIPDHDDEDVNILEMCPFEPEKLAAVTRFNASLRTGSVAGVRAAVRDGGHVIYTTAIGRASEREQRNIARTAAAWATYLKAPVLTGVIGAIIERKKESEKSARWNLEQRLCQAIEQGHEDLVHYLVEELQVRVTHQAVFCAEKNGRDELMRYLYEREQSYCSVM